jgi:hypothetical protein
MIYFFSVPEIIMPADSPVKEIVNSYQFAFNRIPRRRGGMKKAKVEAEVKNFLNLN